MYSLYLCIIVFIIILFYFLIRIKKESWGFGKKCRDNCGGCKPDDDICNPRDDRCNEDDCRRDFNSQLYKDSVWKYKHFIETDPGITGSFNNKGKIISDINYSLRRMNNELNGIKHKPFDNVDNRKIQYTNSRNWFSTACNKLREIYIGTRTIINDIDKYYVNESNITEAEKRRLSGHRGTINNYKRHLRNPGLALYYEGKYKHTLYNLLSKCYQIINQAQEFFTNRKNTITNEGFQSNMEGFSNMHGNRNNIRAAQRNSTFSANNRNLKHPYDSLVKKYNAYAGNKFIPHNRISDTSNSFSNFDIPYNVRDTAYKENLPFTLKQCHNKYNDIDSRAKYTNKINNFNENEKKEESSSINYNPNKMKDSIDFTKSIGFWDNGVWDNIETVDNASYCNSIQNNNINTQEVQESDLLNYGDKAKNLELKRRQIVNFQTSIYKKMTGVGAEKTLNIPKVQCPTVSNEDEPIENWERAQDGNQNPSCLQYNIIEPSNQVVNGEMKPGELVNNKDIWLENATELNSLRKSYMNFMNNDKAYNYNNPLDTQHTDLLRLSGNSIQHTLQDRDWTLSTNIWKDAYENKESKSLDYFLDHYITMFGKSKIINRPFYIEIDGNETQGIAYIIKDKENIQNMTFRGNSGFIRLYRNMYRYNDYKVGNNIIVPLSNIPNFIDKMVAITYTPSYWDLEDLIGCHDLYIICSNTQNINDLYNPRNGFMCYHTDEQFLKCYYSKKQDNPDFLYTWKIYKRPDGKYLIYNKKIDKYLSFGKYYSNYIHFNLLAGVLDDENLPQTNKESREPCLYYCSTSYLDNNDNDIILITKLMEEITWDIKSEGNNKYIITHSSGATLYFTSNVFEQHNDNKDIAGLIKCSFSDEMCDNISDVECYNKYFFIIPQEPKDITNEFHLRNKNEKNTNHPSQKGNLPWYKDLLNSCSSNNRTLDYNGKWFRVINNSFKVPYPDINNEENEFSNIHNMYSNNERIITTLKGGGGYACSKSNYCHVEKEPLNQGNNNISLSYINKEGQKKTNIMSQPIHRNKWKCKKNKFNTFRIYNNSLYTDLNNEIHPNISMDNIASNEEDIIALHVFSYSNSYKEGVHFGICPNGTYIWFLDDMPLEFIGFYQERKNYIMDNYVVLENRNLSSFQKNKRKIILQWFDILKFRNIGYNSIDNSKLYSY